MSSVCSSSCVSSPITPVDLRQQHAESSGVNMSRDYGKGLMDEVGADNESLDENIMNRMANLDALDAPLFDDNILMKGHSSKLGVGDMIHPPPPVSPKRGRSLRGQVYQRPSNVSLETIGQLGPMNKNIADFSLGQQQEKQQHEQETFPREKRTPLYNDSHSSVPPSTVTPLVNTAMPSNQLGGNVGGPGTSAMHMPRSIESSSHRISLSTRHPSNLNFKRAIQQYNSQHSSLPFCDKNESTVVRSLSKLRGPARYQYVETDIGLGYLVDDWGPRGTDEEEVVIGCWAVPYGSIGASVKTMEALVKHRCHGSDPDEDPNGDTSVSSAVDKQQRLDLFLENEEQRLQAQADHEIQARKVREHLVQTVAAGSLEQGSTSLLLPLVVRSHSVLILDVRSEAEMTVESRKNERSRRDIWGCHDRSDALWLGTVLEFVARRIDNSMGRGAMMEWEMDRLHEEPEFGSSQNSQKRQSGERRARCGVDLLSVVIMGQSTSSSKLSEAATSSTQGAKVGSFIEAGGTEVTFDTLMPEAVEGATVLLAYEPISWSLYGRLADMRDAACPKEELPKATGVNSSSDNDYDIYDDGDESDEEEGINEGQSEEQIPVSCWTPQASKSLLAIPESVRSQMASTGGFSALGLSNRALMNSPPPPPPPKPRPDLIRPLLPSLRLAEQILARHDSHSGTLDAVAVVIASCGKHTDGVLPRSRGRKEAKGKSAGSEVMRNGAVVLEDLVGRGVALMGGSKKIGLLTSSGQSKGSKDEVEHDVKQQQSKKLTPKEIEDAAIEIITNLAKRYGRRLVVGTIAVCPAAPVVPGGVLGEQGVTFLCSIDDSLANSRLGGTRCAPSSQTLSGSMTSKKSLLSCHGGSLEETKGQDSENFSLLSHLADLAASFGCAGQFHRPPPTATDIGNAFATLEMALSDLQLETCVESLNSTLLSSIPSESMWTRPVRTVTREPCRLGHAPIPMAVENTISAFFPGDCYHIFCYPNLSRKIWDIETAQFVNVPLQFFPTAGGVAFKRAAFGENSRGYVHRCFEVAADGRTVVGSSLVAKEDRFVPQSVGQQGVVDYALMHCIEQTEAEGLARIFNRHLDGMTFLDPTVARISFVECSVYQLSNATGQTTVSVLVEPKLNPAKLNQFTVRKKSPPLDDDIVEEVERRIDSFDPWNVSLPERGSYLSVSPIEVAECFSHFTYVHSLGKSFVCDLQGEYDADSSMFRLTDPTIYSYEVPKASSGKRAMAFQNVDRNKRALNDFFHSHECGPLCRHVLKEYLKPPPKIPEGTNANRGSAPKKCGWEGRGEGVEDYFPTCVPVSTGGRGGFYNKWIPSLKIPRSFESASSSLAKMLSRGMDDASAVKEVTLDTLQSMCGPGDIR
uniref:Alpha-type protein kinase domain-containing protein n=2 Tax=Corethron hystrix TaxID=216773 RepID=A0A6U5L0N5_9STRA|mmetsp:Transcript_40961/g.96153  ORF Transcript_40961/g.96153 Transcript_40961/m.96153 type:complete len:1368 (+) Transcript_40961:2656-6759(+)